MQIYYLRCIAADYDNMIQLGVLLGALQVIPASTRTVQRPTAWEPDNFVEKLMAYDPVEDYNWEKSEEWNADYKEWYEANPFYETINLGGQPTAYEEFTEVVPETVVATNGGCYDLIGTTHKPTGEIVETEFGPQPVMVPRCDPDGNPYVHANLITPVNLREAAEALAAARPEIAAGLADLSKYFVTAADGNAVAPTQPHRVFAT